MKIECSLDRLILKIENVSEGDFTKLQHFVSEGERLGYSHEMKYWIGKTIRDYHHNIKIGVGEGAILFSWKHNNAKERANTYHARIETNPAKHNKGHDWFFQIFKTAFRRHKKLIRGFDLAFDVDRDIKSIMPVSLTGRHRRTYRDTIYFGQGNNHGYFKQYDKKAEREKEGVLVTEEHLTRIEYSVRADELSLLNLPKLDLKMNEDYQISVIDLEGVDGLVKACVIALSTGQMELNELTRTYKNKTKKALESMTIIDLDNAYQSAKPYILNLIESYMVDKT